LKRYTDSSHPDHPLITSAIEIIERVAISNEKSHERKINISTLVALEKRFYNVRHLPTPELFFVGVVLCGVVWYGMVWCGVVWYGMVWCGVVWCGVVYIKVLW